MYNFTYNISILFDKKGQFTKSRNTQSFLKLGCNINKLIKLTQAMLKITKKVWGWDRPVCIAYCILRVRRSTHPRRIGRTRCRSNRRAPASPAAAESPSPDSGFYRRVWVGSGAGRVHARFVHPRPFDWDGERRRVGLVEEGFWWGWCWKREAFGWKWNRKKEMFSRSTPPPPPPHSLSFFGLGNGSIEFEVQDKRCMVCRFIQPYRVSLAVGMLLCCADLVFLF